MADRSYTGRRGFGRPARTVLAVAFPLLTACYSYTEVSPLTVTPGSNVRVRIAPQAQLPIATVPLAPDTRVLEGTVLRGSSADTLLCAIPVRNGDVFSSAQRLRGTVAVPVAALERVEVRRLQKGRTAAAVGGGAVLGLFLLDWAFNVTLPGQEGNDDPGDVNNLRIPLFRLRW